MSKQPGNEDEFPSELMEMIKPGTAVRVRYEHHPHKKSQVLHIRAIVDDEYVVYRVWRGGGWRYAMDLVYGFWLKWRDGRLEKP